MKKILLLHLIVMVILLSACKAGTKEITVHFDTQGGTSIESITLNESGVISLPPFDSTLKDGYEFLGWYTEETFENRYDFSTIVSDDLVLYANWLELCEGAIIDGECILLDVPDQYEINIFAYGGTNTFYQDIGNSDIQSTNFQNAIDAGFYAVAKEFNTLYPEVTINLYTAVGHPNHNFEIVAKMDELEQMYGIEFSIWHTNDLPNMLHHGKVADLSIFSSTPQYRNIMPSLMRMMNYKGMQAGLPFNVIPQGILINRDLAIDHGIEIPIPNWTLVEYTNFISNSVSGQYYGSDGINTDIILTADSLTKALYVEDDYEYVNLGTQQVKELVWNSSNWYEHSLFNDENADDILQAANGWPYKVFADGHLLTLNNHSWMLSNCVGGAEEYLACVDEDIDYYPLPGKEASQSTIGINMEALVVNNFCLNDGNVSCSTSEIEQIYANYLFAAFYTQDNEAFEARTKQTWGIKNLSANGMAFPVARFDDFETQMEMWYDIEEHKHFEDHSNTPGFYTVVDIYKNNYFWDTPSTVYPLHIQVEGNQINILEDLMNAYLEFPGVHEDFELYLETQLPVWDEDVQSKLEQKFQQLKDDLLRYYGIQ